MLLQLKEDVLQSSTSTKVLPCTYQGTSSPALPEPPASLSQAGQ
jgi:hypothetical protein